MSEQTISLSHKVLNVTVLVAGLGYLVDMFDMFLFNMMRVTSLKDLGFSGDALTSAGLFISNAQMAGLIAGACLWGVISDKYGRKTGLLYSIALYSLGTLGSSCVWSEQTYAIMRFITGVGLAGELGAGIALITEKLSSEKRGGGVMVFITLGFIGVLLAALTSEFIYWRCAYLIGGIAGLLLLAMRMLLTESDLFKSLHPTTRRGDFLLIFKNPVRLKKYICGIFLLAPAVFIPQLLWTLSPEIGKAMGIEGIKANIILGLGYTGVIAGDLLASALSEKLQSRKKAALVFLMLGITIFITYMIWPITSLTAFYIYNSLLGLTFGVWVITVVWVAEQFGTNIRGTVATTSPNFARGLTIPMNIACAALKPYGILPAIAIIGTIIFILAAFSLKGLSETYGKNLDYVEN